MNAPFLRVFGYSEPKYTSEVCNSLKISCRLDFKNSEYDDFRNFKTSSCKNCLIPGERETRNVYSRICRNKIGNCYFSVFFFVGQCFILVIFIFIFYLFYLEKRKRPTYFSSHLSIYQSKVRPVIYEISI